VYIFTDEKKKASFTWHAVFMGCYFPSTAHPIPITLHFVKHSWSKGEKRLCDKRRQSCIQYCVDVGVTRLEAIQFSISMQFNHEKLPTFSKYSSFYQSARQNFSCAKINDSKRGLKFKRAVSLIPCVKNQGVVEKRHTRRNTCLREFLPVLGVKIKRGKYVYW